MAINDVINNGWHGHSLQEVREAIQTKLGEIDAAIDALVAPDIVNDLTTGGAEKVLSAQQGVVLKALIDAKASLSNETDRLEQGQSAAIVLKSMGATLDGDSSYSQQDGDYFFSPTQKKIIYIKPPTTPVSFNPDPLVVYCNAKTGLLYRWDDNEEKMVVVSQDKNEIELGGKADLKDGTGMLTPAQWPKTILTKVSADMPDPWNPSVGDVWYDAGVLWLTTDDLVQPNISLGAPLKSVIYYCSADDKFYRWTGSSFSEAVMAPYSGDDTKADLMENYDMLDPTQWPRVVVNSMTSTDPRTPVPGDITYSTITQHLGLLTENDFLDLGEPLPGTIYVERRTGSLYIWDDGYWQAVSAPTDETGRVLDSAMSRVVLDGIDQVYQSGPNSIRFNGTYHFTDGYIRHRYYTGSVYRTITYSPAENIIYADKSTGKFYCWDATNSSWILLGGGSGGSSVDVSGKADLLSGTDMLKPAQWPQVVIKNIENDSELEPADGDIYYEETTPGSPGILYLHDEDNNTNISLGSPRKGTIYVHKSTNRIYRWNGTEFVALKAYSSGGDGDTSSGTSAAIVSEGDATDAEDTLYFFADSPFQFVGSYNKLVQEGVENGVAYNPAALYDVQHGMFREVEASENLLTGNISFIGNRVYYNRVATTMMRYGDVRLSASVLYASTSDKAVFSMCVNGPFYASSTSVTLTYDDTKVDVYQYDGTSYTIVSSGSSIVFTIDDFYVPRRFKAVRKDTDFSTALSTTLTFNNGYENTTLRILYSVCTLFYKDGTSYSPFDASNAELHASSGSMTLTPSTSTFNLSNAGYLVIKKNHTADLSKENRLYAAVTSFTGATIMCLGATHDVYDHNNPLYSSSASYDPLPVIRRYGEATVSCRLKNFRTCAEQLMDLQFYHGQAGAKSTIREIGLLTYSDPF